MVTDAANNVYVGGTTRLNNVTESPDVTVVRFDANGMFSGVQHMQLNTTITTTHLVQGIALDSAGRIVVTSFDRLGGTSTSGISVWRLLPTLELDSSFGEFGTGVSHWTRDTFTDVSSYFINANNGLSVAIDSTDRPVIVGGWFTSAGDGGPMLLRTTTSEISIPPLADDIYPADGTPDGAMRLNEPVDEGWTWDDIQIAGDGDILLSGQRATPGSSPATVWRVTPAGALDTAFDSDGYNGWLPVMIVGSPRPFDFGLGLVIDGSGRIVVAGSARVVGGTAAVWRFGGDGAIERGFGVDGRAEFLSNPMTVSGFNAVYLDSAGNIVAIRYDAPTVTFFRLTALGLTP